MIILDTNVLSELTGGSPHKNVLAWLDRQPRPSIWTTSVTVFEAQYGLQIMQAGKRRSDLAAAFEGFLKTIEQRVLSFDPAAAEMAASLMAARKKKGRPVEMRDTMIAGIVLIHHATLATRNTSDFEDVSRVINPWAT
jgi:predicted nucleic acid-binding protein